MKEYKFTIKLTFFLAIIASVFVLPARAAQPAVGSNGAVKTLAATVILPGDEIKLSVFREPDLKQELKVGADGKVTLHLVGPVSVAGLTERQAETLIRESYAKDVLVNPSVSLSVYANQQPGKVVVHGRVGKPGVYTFPEGHKSISILEAVGMAGGFTRYAYEKRVQVRRVENGKATVRDVDAKKISTDKNADDFQIFPGDVIFVRERII